VAGGILGVWLAHLMFDLAPLQVSQTIRSSPGQWLSEAVATFGLLLTIFGCLVSAPASVPYAVGLYITAAYWFTASTSFANPAVTVARSLSDTFAGIAPVDAPAFLAAQIVGAGVAVAVSAWLWRAPPAAGAQL
jgi:glycerol uptake facilitator-like aquaporin